MKLFNKFLVQRRDGTVPEWPWLVIAAADPVAPYALHAYAEEARRLGLDSEYCDQVDALADRFDEWRRSNHMGDPDAPAHRPDDPNVVALIPEFATRLPVGGQQ